VFRKQEAGSWLVLEFTSRHGLEQRINCLVKFVAGRIKDKMIVSVNCLSVDILLIMDDG